MEKSDYRKIKNSLKPKYKKIRNKVIFAGKYWNLYLDLIKFMKAGNLIEIVNLAQRWNHEPTKSLAGEVIEEYLNRVNAMNEIVGIPKMSQVVTLQEHEEEKQRYQKHKAWTQTIQREKDQTAIDNAMKEVDRVEKEVKKTIYAIPREDWEKKIASLLMLHAKNHEFRNLKVVNSYASRALDDLPMVQADLDGLANYILMTESGNFKNSLQTIYTMYEQKFASQKEEYEKPKQKERLITVSEEEAIERGKQWKESKELAERVAQAEGIAEPIMEQEDYDLDKLGEKVQKQFDRDSIPESEWKAKFDEIFRRSYDARDVETFVRFEGLLNQPGVSESDLDDLRQLIHKALPNTQYKEDLETVLQILEQKWIAEGDIVKNPEAPDPPVQEKEPFKVVGTVQQIPKEELEELQEEMHRKEEEKNKEVKVADIEKEIEEKEQEEEKIEKEEHKEIPKSEWSNIFNDLQKKWGIDKEEPAVMREFHGYYTKTLE